MTMTFMRWFILPVHIHCGGKLLILSRHLSRKRVKNMLTGHSWSSEFDPYDFGDPLTLDEFPKHYDYNLPTKTLYTDIIRCFFKKQLYCNFQLHPLTSPSDTFCTFDVIYIKYTHNVTINHPITLWLKVS